MKAIATKATYLGNHISYSLSSIPKPHLNGHLVKDALKSAKSGLANAAGWVVRACRPDETVAPPAPPAPATPTKSVTFGGTTTFGKNKPNARRDLYAKSKPSTNPKAPTSSDVRNVSSKPSASSSEEESTDATASRLDFQGLNAFASEFTPEDLAQISKAINPLMHTLDKHLSIANSGKPGTAVWMFAVKTVIASIGQLSELTGKMGSDYLSANGSNHQFAVWLDIKLTDLRAEQKAWQAKLSAAL